VGGVRRQREIFILNMVESHCRGFYQGRNEIRFIFLKMTFVVGWRMDCIGVNIEPDYCRNYRMEVVVTWASRSSEVCADFLIRGDKDKNLTPHTHHGPIARQDFGGLI
jgi:hypothetical protein